MIALVRLASVLSSCIVLLGLAACASESSGSDGIADHEEEDPGDVASDDVNSNSYSCGAGTGTAYENGVVVGTLPLMKIGTKLVSVKTGHAYLKLRTLMKAKGIALSVNSGFRTMKEQQYFYNCYKTKTCNNGNFAYEPGFSNHQSGRAVDLQMSTVNHPKFRAVLKSEGLTDAWKETVPGERWHWEFFGADPGGPCGAASPAGVDAGAPDSGG